MRHRRGLAMHQARRAADVTSERLAHALLAEAYAQNRQFPREFAENRERDAGFLRRARPGRYNDRVRMKSAHARDIDRVVALDGHIGAELAEILHEVVSERIVVVDHQDAHDVTYPPLPARGPR